MARASNHQPASSPIFRLDSPETLDVDAHKAAAAKPQRGAWRYLADLFEQAGTHQSHQFSIEPDATLWRIRYRCVEGYVENIVDDPSVLIWALDALQIALWGEEYHDLDNRTTRFTWAGSPVSQLVELKVLDTVNGELLQFDTEPLQPMPPTLDELHLQSRQLDELRARLKQQSGMILLTGNEPYLLDNALLAMNQELISPDRNLLSVSKRHRYSLPRTTQVCLAEIPDAYIGDTWKRALETSHNAVLINADVPAQFHEKLANACDQGILIVQAMLVSNAAESLNRLNASVIRRTPLHRAVNTVVNQFHVNTLCQGCACNASLTDDEIRWLEQLRTPVTENVVGWLADGNTEQFMLADGCESCHGTGKGKPLSVFDIVHRDEKSHLFPIGPQSSSHHKTKALQHQLMSLARAGNISLSEVFRVLEQAG